MLIWRFFKTTETFVETVFRNTFWHRQLLYHELGKEGTDTRLIKGITRF